jgi:hypothetical protein
MCRPDPLPGPRRIRCSHRRRSWTGDVTRWRISVGVKLAHRKDVNGWWPQGDGPAAIVDDSWTVHVNYGDSHDEGFQFEIAAVIVTQAGHERWLEWVQNVKSTGLFPPVHLPTAPHVLTERFQTVHRATR